MKSIKLLEPVSICLSILFLVGIINSPGRFGPGQCLLQCQSHQTVPMRGRCGHPRKDVMSRLELLVVGIRLLLSTGIIFLT